MFPRKATNRGVAHYVTFIANYIPLQDAYGGPNYFNLDPKAVYEIQVDNDGNGGSAICVSSSILPILLRTWRWSAGGEKIVVPLINIGPVDVAGANLNLIQSYSITRSCNGRREPLGNATLGGAKFFKPTDNLGHKSIAGPSGYAAHFIYEAAIPDCRCRRGYSSASAKTASCTISVRSSTC